MLFFFRGNNGPAVRAIVGALLIVFGLAVHGGAIFAGIGAVLLLWGGFAVLNAKRVGRMS